MLHSILVWCNTSTYWNHNKKTTKIAPYSSININQLSLPVFVCWSSWHWTSLLCQWLSFQSVLLSWAKYRLPPCWPGCLFQLAWANTLAQSVEPLKGYSWLIWNKGHLLVLFWAKFSVGWVFYWLIIWFGVFPVWGFWFEVGFWHVLWGWFGFFFWNSRDQPHSIFLPEHITLAHLWAFSHCRGFLSGHCGASASLTLILLTSSFLCPITPFPPSSLTFPPGTAT